MIRKLFILLLVLGYIPGILNSIDVSFLADELVKKEYQVSVLQKSCREQQIETEFTARADQLYQEFLQSLSGDRKEISFRKLDKAFIFYRLALGLNDLENSKQRHQKQIESLQLARQELAELQEQLENLEGEMGDNDETEQ